MRKTLVIVNYMRVNPTIVDDFVEYYHDRFEKIYIVNRNTNDTYKNIKSYKNVFIKEVNPKKRFFICIKSIFTLINKVFIDDTIYSIKIKKLSIRNIVSRYKFHTISNFLLSVLNGIKEIKNESETVSMLSIWFTYEAYALARLKKKYPKLNCVSMAHAHEIETFTNDNTFYYKRYIHKYLDSIKFISKSKMETYFKNVCIPLGIDTSTCSVLYWGSKFYCFDLEKRISNNFVICSCSTVEPLKRVEEIAKAISLLPENVEWHHFGDGRSMNILLEIYNSFPDNVRKRMHIHGRIDNIKIKEFYATNNIDLFINFSTIEGLPISVMEALSYGIPCVVTDVGGEKEIINEGFNGHLIPKDSTHKDLASVIYKFINLSMEERLQYKKNAKEIWNERFNLDKNIYLYLDSLK